MTTSTTNDAIVTREDLMKAVTFLRQFAAKLERSAYPHDEFRKTVVEDLADRLERARAASSL